MLVIFNLKKSTVEFPKLWSLELKGKYLLLALPLPGLYDGNLTVEFHLSTRDLFSIIGFITRPTTFSKHLISGFFSKSWNSTKSLRGTVSK